MDVSELTIISTIKSGFQMYAQEKKCFANIH